MTAVHGWIASPGDDTAEPDGVRLALDHVLGVWDLTSGSDATGDPMSEIAGDLCALINEARQTRDLSTGEIHRKRLIKLGYEARSSIEGTFARNKSA
ncbi:MAG: hypothetical protein AAF670_05585 [Planctomycetota bacterium]